MITGGEALLIKLSQKLIENQNTALEDIGIVISENKLKN